MGSTVSVILGLVLAVLVLVLFTVKLKIHPFFALIATSATFAIVAGMNMQDMLSAFTGGMGGTIADIGLVIALGTVTGTLLEKSGAAETMAKTILKITGKKHAALGLAITGYFVSIPVFCDSAFVLLSPIARRLSNAASEIRQAHWFDAWIVNDNLDKAYDELRAVYLASTLHPAHRPGLANTILEG